MIFSGKFRQSPITCAFSNIFDFGWWVIFWEKDFASLGNAFESCFLQFQRPISIFVVIRKLTVLTLLLSWWLS